MPLSETMLLPTRFADLIDDIHQEAPDVECIHITGDAHGTFAMWLMPLLKGGYLSLAKDEPKEIQLQYLQRLDEILESTLLDQLQNATIQRQSLLNNLNIPQARNFKLKLIDDLIFLLKEKIAQQVIDFDNIMAKLRKEKECKLVDLGDSLGDRGYCDAFMLIAAQTLTSLNIDFASILANHTIETIYALTSNQWEPNTRPAFISKNHPLQIRSLNNFRTLLHHNILSSERKNELLLHWIEHMHLVAYSYDAQQDSSQPETSLYYHAPNELNETHEKNNIFRLARDYCKLPIPSVQNMPIDSIEYHQLIRKLIQDINDYFRKTFFTKETGDAFKKFVASTHRLVDWKKELNLYDADEVRAYNKFLREVISNPFLVLNEFISETKLPHASNCPNTFTFYHGHYTFDDLDNIPQNLIGLDNKYCKPGEEIELQYEFTDYEKVQMNKFLSLQEASLKKGTLYYTLYSNDNNDNEVAYKGVSTDGNLYEQNTEIIGTSTLLAPAYFYSSHPLKQSPNTLDLYQPLSPQDFPTFSISKTICYDMNVPESTPSLKVPIAKRSFTENFSHVFHPTPINQEVIPIPHNVCENTGI